MSTDNEWERWGRQDPYYGVLTNPRFRRDALTPEAKEEFFGSGSWHTQYVIQRCHTWFDPDFKPRRVLDFGCGVGRLVVPFAALAPEVVGVDVSPAMLAEARRNCDERGAGHVVLVRSDDELTEVKGSFDLVHSSIVLQHIPVDRGMALFARLVGMLRPGGIGALHVTFAWDVFAESLGQPLPPPSVPSPGLVRRWLGRWRRRHKIAAAPTPVVGADPEMQMNLYPLSQLHYVLHQGGIQQVHTEFTDHGGVIGAFMFFRRPG